MADSFAAGRICIRDAERAGAIPGQQSHREQQQDKSDEMDLEDLSKLYEAACDEKCILFLCVCVEGGLEALLVREIVTLCI